MHNDGIITAPVNTDDVVAVLGENSHDIGTLCLSKKIRKYNKNKPYRGDSPAVYSRDVNNATNQTGVYLGSRGAATGFPVYWGMKYPMNTAQQNGSGLSDCYLLELCYDVVKYQGSKPSSGRGHPNFEYVPPVSGVDFFRLDDFVGYNHNNTIPFIEAFVVGSTPGNMDWATLSVNAFEAEQIHVLAYIPPNSGDWQFSELIPDANNYYLVAEIYKEEVFNANNRGAPVLVRRSGFTLGDGPNSLIIDIDLSDIKFFITGGDTAVKDFNFIVCVGFNKYNGETPVGSSGFVAPWDMYAHRCVTRVLVNTASPYVVKLLKYALPNPTTESQYKDLSLEPVNISNDTMFFKAQFQNNSNKEVYLSNFIFTIKAQGAYGDYRNENIGYIAQGGNDVMGPERTLSFGEKPNTSSDNAVITIPANSSKDVYFKAENFIPYGITTLFIFTVKDKTGTISNTTGMYNVQFRRIV